MEAQSSKLAEAGPGRIRVLFDARKLGHGGIGVYAENLIGGLYAQPEVDLSLIVRTGFFEESGVDQYGWLKVLPYVEDTARSYSLDELLSFGRRINFSEFDVYHCPHYTLPYRIPIPTVITVHDLIQPTRVVVQRFCRFLVALA